MNNLLSDRRVLFKIEEQENLHMKRVAYQTGGIH